MSDASLSLVALTFVAKLSAGGLSLVPAGLGVVDAAMVLVLTGGGIPLTLATATVVLYRLISLLLIAALGWALFAVMSRRSGLVPAPDPEPHEPSDLTHA